MRERDVALRNQTFLVLFCKEKRRSARVDAQVTPLEQAFARFIDRESVKAGPRKSRNLSSQLPTDGFLSTRCFPTAALETSLTAASASARRAASCSCEGMKEEDMTE